VHRQSVIHSMVEFTDGATVAQLSLPDMRLPIGYALAFPDRLPVPFGRIDWTALARLDFEPPDTEAFPCLRLAYEAGRVGGGTPALLNAANEVAVAAFLEGRIRWTSIPDVLEEVLARHDGGHPDTVDAVIETDARGRSAAREVLAVMPPARSPS
jgi:1-deoxy-D-xylulose-5-phosphate reductoisomerase